MKLPTAGLGSQVKIKPNNELQHLKKKISEEVSSKVIKISYYLII